MAAEAEGSYLTQYHTASETEAAPTRKPLTPYTFSPPSQGWLWAALDNL